MWGAGEGGLVTFKVGSSRQLALFCHAAFVSLAAWFVTCCFLASTRNNTNSGICISQSKLVLRRILQHLSASAAPCWEKQNSPGPCGCRRLAVAGQGEGAQRLNTPAGHLLSAAKRKATSRQEFQPLTEHWPPESPAAFSDRAAAAGGVVGGGADAIFLFSPYMRLPMAATMLESGGRVAPPF